MCDTSILAELKPCGYILSTREYKFFALQCLCCEMKYGNWATFLQHLKQCNYDFSIRQTINNVADAEKPNKYAAISVETDTAGISAWLYEADELEDQLIEEIPYDIKDNQNCYTMTAKSLPLTDGEAEDLAMPLVSVMPIDYLKDDKYSSDEFSSHTKDANHYTEDQWNEYNTEGIAKFYFKDQCSDYNNDDSARNYNDEYNGNNKQFIHELNINLNEENSLTTIFIQLYKSFPLLWCNQKINSNLKQQNLVKNDLIKLLSEYNILVSMDALEKSISKLHSLYSDITRRLEEGLEISHIEEKYLTECMFLKSGNYSLPLDLHANDQSESGESSCATSDDETMKNHIVGPLIGSDGSDEAFHTKGLQKVLLKFSTRNQVTCNFIQCFQDQSCLWNPQHPAYNDLKERIQAYHNIKSYFLANHRLPLAEGNINSAIKRLYSFYKRCVYTHRNLIGIRKYYYELCAFLSDVELDTLVHMRNDSLRKISFTNIDEFTFGFIDLCEKHPILWDKNHPYYSGFKARKEAYEEMATNLKQTFDVDFSNEELYEAISRLKQHFYCLQRKKLENEVLTKQDNDFLARCSFLPPSKRNLQCHICEQILRSQSTLQTHLLRSHNIGQLPYKCDYCEQRFAQRNMRKEHEVRAHTKEFEWFCSYCSKGFANRRDMEMHEMIHTGVRKSICEHCGRSFRLKHQMNEHVKIVHERLRRYKCTMCTKDFLRKRQLDDHIRVHLNIRDKVCTVCGKGFTNVHGLFRHKQLHSDVKRYECKVCGERFHQFGGLNSHMKRKHKIIKQKDSFNAEEKKEANGK